MYNFKSVFRPGDVWIISFWVRRISEETNTTFLDTIVSKRKHLIVAIVDVWIRCFLDYLFQLEKEFTLPLPPS